MTTATLTSERRQQIEDIFMQAKDLLTGPSPYWHVPIPVPIPTMARKIAGDILGWPLHLRNKPIDEDGQTAVVMPVMRHKPHGVSLLPSQPRIPRSEPVLPPKSEPSLVMPTNLGPNNPFALRAAFEADNLIGTRVRKHFDGKDTEGSVIRQDELEGGKYYYILYDDGNTEHYTPHEVELRKL